MNVFFDSLWWWRQEFLGQPDPFNSANQSASQVADALVGFPDIFSYDENYFGLYDNTLSFV
jgi:hypothetical protein